MTEKFCCRKCGYTDFEADEMRAAGGGWSGVFDIETRRFTVVTCLSCGFSELYKGKLSALVATLDFLSWA